MKMSKKIGVIATLMSVLLMLSMVAYAYVVNGVSTSSANVYSTSGGSSVIGSIGMDENLNLGSTANNRRFITYQTANGDKTGWVSTSAVTATDWRWPLACFNRTQNFGNYYADKGGYHLAIDATSSVYQDNVRAPWDGVVRYKGYSSGNGNHVIVEHLNNDGVKLFSLYSHLASFNADIVAGFEFSKGQMIGQMGSTGTSAKHLHFSIYDKNFSTDPIGYTSSGPSSYYLVSRDTFKITMNCGGTVVNFYHPQYVVRNGGNIP